VKVTLDQMNAAFELGGAFLRTLDCVKLFQAKRFMGGHLGTALYFLLWGVFNVFFYPSLHQEWSFWAAIALMTINGVWFVMAVHYNYFAAGRRVYDPRAFGAGILLAALLYGMIFRGGWTQVSWLYQ